ncbi:E3 ubiquitin-protein ligase RBBP6-like isoform X3 [Syngnathus acus]|uniref:E3 ubiquitin-protein ligase RBBP6-like isoform X3 n=1 Tax=Syngnathus acus TaxID=161584 RepID=UPI001886379C|nr:E3 ubiquitin-protein ligase RBBP6-like isoform X3 [Syngnathus acus]
MTHIHYKFSSKLSYSTVVFDGPHITLMDLKERIMGREKLRAGDCDLQITNAQTKEEYTDEEGLIPKGSSVIVRRVPNIRVAHKKTKNIERSDARGFFASGVVKAMDDKSSSKSLPLFSRMVNLADADVSEDDKIKVMMNQSSYDPTTYNKKIAGALPANYTCFRCGSAGHHIRKCPSSGDKNFDAPPKIKKSSGIPRSFLVEVDDPTIKGAMLTNCGRFAIPAIDAQAYAVGKKEKHPFLHKEESEPQDELLPVPEELQCLICHDLLVDSVVIPCCGNSYCDDCIRTTLLDSEGHVCPTCNESDVSPDTLIANKFLRQAVNNFKKEKDVTGSLKGKSSAPTPNPVPSPVATQQQIHQSTHNLQAAVNEPVARPGSSLQSSVQAEEKAQDEPKTQVHNDSVQRISLVQAPTSIHSSSLPSVCPPGVPAEFQPLPPASSSNPSAPPPLFLGHHFRSLPAGQQYLSHPPGHPVALPNWTHPNPQGTPIPPLMPSSSSSIPPHIQREWFSHHRHRSERSPDTRSTYRRSSRSKSKSSRSSSRSSRSRSKSHGRSRSPYSRHRVSHTRTNPSRSYSYGYKRSHSPTASSSSSPREGPRSTSKSDHRKKRHHSKKSSHGSCKSRRREERSSPSSKHAEGQPNTDYYEEWKRQYKEWYDKYFSSYVSHYHQLPPPPNPIWAGRAENHSSYNFDSFDHFQHNTLTRRHSPPSQSSNDSRSSRSQSSSEGRSPPSRSSSDSSSPPPRSPPSKNAATKDGRAQGATANERIKRFEVSEDNTRSADAAHATGRKEKRKRRNTASDSIPHSDVSDAVQNPLKSNEQEKQKQENKKKCKKESNSQRRDGESGQNVKSSKKASKVEKDIHTEVSKASKSESEGKNKESSTLEIPKDESPQLVDEEKPQEPKKEEKKPLKNIWEEGMKVRPQKKISINIKLDAKRPEEKIEIQEGPCSERSDAKEDGEKLEGEAPVTEKQQATGLHELQPAEEEDWTEPEKGDERLNIKETEGDEMGNVMDNERVTGNDGEQESLIVEENIEDESERYDDREKERASEIEEDDSLANEERAIQQDESVAEELPQESKPDEDLMEGVKMKNGSDKDTVMMSHSSERPNITADGGDSTLVVDPKGGEESPERRIQVTTPPQEQKHGQDDTIELLQAPFFKLEEEEPEVGELEPLSFVPPPPPPEEEPEEVGELEPLSFVPPPPLEEEPEESELEPLSFVPPPPLEEEPEESEVEPLSFVAPPPLEEEPEESELEPLSFVAPPPLEEEPEESELEPLSFVLPPPLEEELEESELEPLSLVPPPPLEEEPEESELEPLSFVLPPPPEEEPAEGELEPLSFVPPPPLEEEPEESELEPLSIVPPPPPEEEPEEEGELEPLSFMPPPPPEEEPEKESELEPLSFVLPPPPEEEPAEGELEPLSFVPPPPLEEEPEESELEPLSIVPPPPPEEEPEEEGELEPLSFMPPPPPEEEPEKESELEPLSVVPPPPPEEEPEEEGELEPLSFMPPPPPEEEPEEEGELEPLSFMPPPPPEEEPEKESELEPLSFMPPPPLEEEPEERELEPLSLVPPVTPGHGETQADSEQESQRSGEPQTDDETRQRNYSLAPSTGQYESDSRDTEMGGKTEADEPVDFETNWKGEEGRIEETEKELPISIQSSLTSHEDDKKDSVQEVNVDGHNSANHNEPNVIPDAKSSEEDCRHVYQHHNNDNTESKSDNRNSPPPSRVEVSGRVEESSRSSLASKPLVNSPSKHQHQAKPRGPPPSKHSDTPPVKAKPMSREEMWKRYKMEKLLKESQQGQAATQPEREASRHDGEAKAERAGGDKPSSHNGSSVKKSEHERRPKKHKKDKHGDADQEELERKHKKSKKKNEDTH